MPWEVITSRTFPFHIIFPGKEQTNGLGEDAEGFLCWDTRWIWADEFAEAGKGSALEFGTFPLLLGAAACGPAWMCWVPPARGAEPLPQKGEELGNLQLGIYALVMDTALWKQELVGKEPVQSMN